MLDRRYQLDLMAEEKAEAAQKKQHLESWLLYKKQAEEEATTAKLVLEKVVKEKAQLAGLAPEAASLQVRLQAEQQLVDYAAEQNQRQEHAAEQELKEELALEWEPGTSAAWSSKDDAYKNIYKTQRATTYRLMCNVAQLLLFLNCVTQFPVRTQKGNAHDSETPHAWLVLVCRLPSSVPQHRGPKRLYRRSISGREFDFERSSLAPTLPPRVQRVVRP